MKIIHTSDWHLGRIRHGKSFEEAHEKFIDWLIEVINTNNVELLLVVGDIFDNPFPATGVLNLYYSLLYKLSKTCLKKIIITSGNHDSPAVLEAPKDILSLLSIQIVASIENLDDLIIPIEKNNNTELVICAVPFLREKDIRKSLDKPDLSRKSEEIEENIAEIYNKLYQKTEDFRKKNIPIITTGHLFVADYEALTPNEIELFIGGLQQLSLKNLNYDYYYFALGHVHRGMKIGNRENIRYSGSPIHLNFSEFLNTKYVVLIDTDENTITPIIVPVFRSLLAFKGSFEKIKNDIENFTNPYELKPWAKLIIEEDKAIPNLEYLILDFKEKTQNVEIVEYEFKYIGSENRDKKEVYELCQNINELSPIDIFKLKLNNYSEHDQNSLIETFMELQNKYLYEDPQI